MLVAALAVFPTAACEHTRASLSKGDAPLLDVRYAGCSAVYLRGARPTCELNPEADLRLWVPGAGESDAAVKPAKNTAQPSAPIHVEWQGERLKADVTPQASGTVVTVRPPPEPDRGTLSVAAGSARFELDVEAGVEAPDFLTQARALKKDGSYGEAEKKLTASLGPLGGRFRGRALGLLARVQRAAGKLGLAEQSYQLAIAAHVRNGDFSNVVNDTTALVYLLIQHGRRLSEGQAWLDALDGVLPNHSDSNYLTAYYQGLVSRKLSDHRNALQHLRRARTEASLMGQYQKVAFAEQVMAHSLAETGSVADALSLMQKAVDRAAATDAPCARMHALLNYGWQLLLERDHGDVQTHAAVDPEPALSEALALAEQRCKGYPNATENARLNLALAAYHNGDLEKAESYLRLAPSAARGTLLQALWTRDLRARIAERNGDFRLALARYVGMLELATNAMSPPARWRALVGQARAHDGLGETEKAHELYHRAELLLSEDSLLVPMHTGRDRFLARRFQATEEHVGSLLRADLPEKAFVAARRARGRWVRQLTSQQRLDALSPAGRLEWAKRMEEYDRRRTALEQASMEAWMVPDQALSKDRARRRALELGARDALDEALRLLGGGEFSDLAPPPPKGTVRLGVFPISGAWVVFAADDQGVRTHRFIAPTSNAAMLGRVLLGPFSASLRRNSRVEVIAAGAAASLDVHALPHPETGRPLLATHRVVYALDLPAAATEPPLGQKGLLGVVADPEGNLPHARREGQRVRELAKSPATLITGAAATRSAVQALMELSQTFHYAGHGLFSAADGFESALSLAESTQITVADVLTLKSPPDTVVLVGCETAKSGRRTPFASLGLGQAFLVAGSRAVIASTRVVQDDLGERFSELLHAEDWGSAESAYHRAARTLMAERPGGDWANFRLLSR